MGAAVDISSAAFDEDEALSKIDDATPHSSEAEQAVLGVILHDNETFNRVSNIVEAKHFYNPIHVRIFDMMAGLISAGKLADAIVLKHRFSQDETLVDIGGVEYLALLLQNSPPVATIYEYAKLVKEMAMRRELCRLGSGLNVEALKRDGEKDSTTLIAEAETDLFELAEQGVLHRGAVSFEKSVVTAIERAAAAFQRDGGLSGLSTGLQDLDQALGGLNRSDLIILAGRPSMGKTALAVNIAFSVASKFREIKNAADEYETADGGRVLFHSLEMSHDQLTTRIIAEQSRVPSNLIRRGDIDINAFDRITDAADRIAKVPLHIDDMGGMAISQLATRARRHKRVHGLDLLVVDYLQLLSGGRLVGNTTNRTQEVTIITQALKALAKELDIPVLALAQLSRQVEQRENKRPQLSDLRESGSIEQDADVVMFAYREEYYLAREEPDVNSEEHFAWQERLDEAQGKAEVIIGKQRHGPIGTVHLRFEDTFTKFTDIAGDE